MLCLPTWWIHDRKGQNSPIIQAAGDFEPPSDAAHRARWYRCLAMSLHAGKRHQPQILARLIIVQAFLVDYSSPTIPGNTLFMKLFVRIVIGFALLLPVALVAGCGKQQDRGVIVGAAIPDAPINYIVLSHSHADHIGGTRFWTDEGTEIVAHRNFEEE
jgi:hypothetical protein